jgi:ferredoxin
MVMKITEDCISCGTCASVCPVKAPKQGDIKYDIDPKKCIECKGYFDEPQCRLYCPICCIVKVEETS